MCGNHDKSMERFFERIIQALITHINFEIVKAVIVASPGFIKDQFHQYMNDYAIKNIQTSKVLIDNKSKFILVHSASGFKHSLKEIFEDPNLTGRLTDTKALGEVKSLDAFYQMLKTEPSRAFYGFKHVEKASEADAIDVLLITDSLFRSKELAERKKYVNIVDRVRENNGQVKIFSSLHVSGEQLLQLTGVAAILRFPMPDLEDEILSESDDEEKEPVNTMSTNNKLVANAADDFMNESEDRRSSILNTGAESMVNSTTSLAVNPSMSTDEASSSTGLIKVNTTANLQSKLPPVLTGSTPALPVVAVASKTPNKKNKKTNKENYYQNNDEDNLAAYRSGRAAAYYDYDDDDYDF